MDQLSDLLTINTFRHKLGLSRKTVYRWIASGAVKSVRVGGQWRIPRYEVCLVRCKGVRQCCAPEKCLYRQYNQGGPTRLTLSYFSRPNPENTVDAPRQRGVSRILTM